MWLIGWHHHLFLGSINVEAALSAPVPEGPPEVPVLLPLTSPDTCCIIRVLLYMAGLRTVSLLCLAKPDQSHSFIHDIENHVLHTKALLIGKLKGI